MSSPGGAAISPYSARIALIAATSAAEMAAPGPGFQSRRCGMTSLANRSMFRRGEVLGQDTELQERDEDAETGALAHPLDAGQHRFGAADQRGAALDEALDRHLAAP